MSLVQVRTTIWPVTIQDRVSLEPSSIEINTLFEQFDKLRINLLRELLNDPQTTLQQLWSGRYGLSQDEQCRVQLNQAKPSVCQRLEQGIECSTSTRAYRCQGCRNLKRITTYTQALSGEFKPVWGKHQGQALILIRSKAVQPEVNDQTGRMQAKMQSYNRELSLRQACQRNLPSLLQAKYLACDEFSQALIANWYLQYVLSLQGLPHIRPIYYSFICDRAGYFLQPSNGKDLHQVEFKKSDIWKLFYQLWALFHSLKEYNLTFSQVDKQTLWLTDQPVDYCYDGVEVQADFNLVLNNLYRTGINLLNTGNGQLTRIYTKSSIKEKLLQPCDRDELEWQTDFELVQPEGGGCSRREGCPGSSVWSYQIRDQPEKRISRLNHDNRLGLPQYNGSFDLYRILLVLAQNPSFYQSIIRDKELNTFWLSLWLDPQDGVLCRLPEMKGRDVTSLLYGQRLRCDLLDWGWSQLKAQRGGKEKPMKSKAKMGPRFSALKSPTLKSRTIRKVGTDCKLDVIPAGRVSGMLNNGVDSDMPLKLKP